MCVLMIVNVVRRCACEVQLQQSSSIHSGAVHRRCSNRSRAASTQTLCMGRAVITLVRQHSLRRCAWEVQLQESGSIHPGAVHGKCSYRSSAAFTQALCMGSAVTGVRQHPLRRCAWEVQLQGSGSIHSDAVHGRCSYRNPAASTQALCMGSAVTGVRQHSLRRCAWEVQLQESGSIDSGAV